MKKLFLISLLLLLTGCGTAPYCIHIEPLSEQEKILLSEAFPNNASSIEEGWLRDIEKEALNQLRAGIEYLEDKYPETEIYVDAFEFKDASPLSSTLYWNSVHTCTVTYTKLGYEYYEGD